MDLGSGRALAHRGDDPFAMCSTFKAYAAGRVLQKAENGELDLQQRFHRPGGVAAQLSGDSATSGRHHVARPIVRGCVATQRQRRGKSVVAGDRRPATEFARSIGDDRTRLDRWEVELNTVVLGDPRDTSTPRALGGGFQKLLTGTILSESQRRQLEEWTRGNATSDLSMRAGLPAGWTTANKT
jgi:beta-lactamase class A